MGATAEGLVLTLFVGMPLDLWLAVWLATGRGGEEYRNAFLALYHLKIVTIEDVEVPYEAVAPVDGFVGWWLEIASWLLDPLSTCVEGCPQSQRP